MSKYCPCHCHVPFGRLPEPCTSKCVLTCKHCSQPTPKGRIHTHSDGVQSWMCQKRECSNSTPKEDWEKELEYILVDWESKSNPILGAMRVQSRMNRLSPFIRFLLSSQKQELIKKFEGIIGEDEGLLPENETMSDKVMDRVIENRLRAEQRKALEALKEDL